MAELTVTPGELFVGSTVVGVATTPATLTLSNAGPLTVTVLGFTNPTAPFSSVAGGTCLAPPFALAPGQSCTRRYVYTPTSSGFHTALFSVTSSAINSPHAVSLSGFADGPGLALGNGTQLDFGTLAVGAPSGGRRRAEAGGRGISRHLIVSMRKSTRSKDASRTLLLAPVHDRMPVIVAPGDYARWLDPANFDAQGRQRLALSECRKHGASTCFRGGAPASGEAS